MYRQQPALYEQDFEPVGFQWIDCNDHENSVISFVRRDRAGQFVVAVLNFTPVPRDGYRIGVPTGGAYDELINSDSESYGGSNIGNAGTVATEPIASHGYADSLRLNLPPLGFLLLQPSRPTSAESAPTPDRRPA